MIYNKIVCESCGEELCFAKDNDNASKTVRINVVCVCGHNNLEIFMGFPKLAGNAKYYFEFIDEEKIKINRR